MDIANILLQITGSSGDARRDLQQTAAEVAAFDRMDAEADLDVDTAIAKAKIASLKRDIATLSDITLDVDADTGLARAQIAALTAELKVQEGIVDAASDSMTGASGSAGDLGFSLAGLTGKIGPAAAAIVALAAVIAGSLAAALVALIASLGAAVAGIGALGVALGATLLPAIGLVVGAVQHFKAEADTAGTAANRLKTAAQRLSQTFESALGPAADQVFGGLADALRSIDPMLGRLRPAFTQFGIAIGNAFRAIGRELSNPAWTRFFEQTIGNASRLIGPMTSSFISLSVVLRNIATAAMPFLIAGFQAIARGLKGMAAGTGDAQGLSSAIGGLVGHLRSWLNLIGQVSRFTLGLFKGAAPAGQRLVDTIAEGARALADWANSARGQDQIRQFFNRVIPLAEQILGLVWDLGVAFVNFVSISAPGIQAFVEDLRSIIQPLNDILTKISEVQGAFEDFTGGGFDLGELANPLNTVTPLGIGRDLGKAIVDGANSVLGGARSSGSRFPAALAAGIRAAQGLPAGAMRAVAMAAARAAGIPSDVIRGIARSQMGTFRASLAAFIPGVRDTGRKTGQAGAGGIKSATPAYKVAGGGLGSVVGKGLAQTKGGLLQAAKALASGAIPAIRGTAGSFKAAGVVLSERVSQGIESRRGAIRVAGKALVVAAAQAVRSNAEGMRSAGVALGQGLLEGLQSVEGAILAWAERIAGQIESKIKNAARVSSPSRMTYALGSQIGEGLVRGLESQTRAVLEAAGGLAVAAITPGGAMIPAGAAGRLATAAPRPAGEQTHNWTVQPLAGGGSPDPDMLLAQLDAKMRARGGF